MERDPDCFVCQKHAGEIRVPGWRPPPIPNSVRVALSGLEVGKGEGAPAIEVV